MKQKQLVVVLVILLCLGSSLFSAGSKEAALQTGEKPTLKVLGPFIPNVDPNNDPSQKAIEDKTGYSVEYSLLPQDSPDQKLNMELASGADYDIVMMNPAWFTSLVEQKALQPIDDLLQKYGQNILSAISAETLKLGQFEGKQYGIPMMNERANIENTILMREDILNKLGLKVPSTTEEFIQVLRAVKKAYPAMIPFSAAPTAGGATSLFSETLISGFGFYFEWNERDGKLLHRVQLPEYRAYLQFLNQLYQEGLLDADIAVNKRVNLDEKFTSGKVFAIPSGWYDASTQIPALYAAHPEAKVTYVSPLKNEQGVAKIRANKYLNKMSAIPRNAKNPEDAIKLINAKLDPEIFTFITLGTEGVTFTKSGNRYEPIMPIFSEWRGNAWWYLNGIREVEYADMWLARTRRNAELGKAFDAANAEYEKYAVIQPTATMPTLSSVAKYSQALGKLVSDHEIMFVLGVEKLQNYDAFLKTWLSSGGSEMVADVNAWYQSTK